MPAEGPSPPVEQILAGAIRLHGAGRVGEAMQLYRAVLERERDHADALHLMGVAHSDLGNPGQAVALIQRAIRLKPDEALYRNNLGNALKRLGRTGEAIGCYRSAAALAPSLAAVRANLGGALVDVRRLDAAASALARALALDARHADTWFALANLAASADDDRADLRFGVTLALEPGYAEAWFNRGNHLREQGRLGEAIICLERAIALNPRDDDSHSNLIFTLCFAPAADAKRQDRASRRWGRMAERGCRPEAPFANHPDPNRRLTIAYLSPDLRRHQFLMQLRPLWRHHDRTAFRVLGYADVERPDEETERLKAMADGWRDISRLDDAALAQAAREDGVDVIVSVTGYLARDRRRFACRKAPVQIAALNQVTATGLASIDGRITDRWLDPPGEPAETAERLIRLDAGFAVFEPPADAPDPGGLPADARSTVTLGSFNNLTKLTDETLRLWAEILEAVPEARLLVKAMALSEPKPQARLRAAFERTGIDPARVELVGRVVDPKEHLSALARADLALDPVPFAGGLSSAEVLWMGVPIVTLMGGTLVARQGASLIARAGLADLIAETPADYVRIGAGLARDRDRLRRLRRGLRADLGRSPLTDGRAYARGFEAACRTLWCEWCERRSGAPG